MILLQQHISNIKPFQNNNTINRNNRKNSNKNKQVKEGFTDILGLTEKTMKNIYDAEYYIKNVKISSKDIIRNITNGNKLEYIRIVARWRDQGWGNRKSRLYLSLKNQESGKEIDIPIKGVSGNTVAGPYKNRGTSSWNANTTFENINFKLYSDMSYTYNDFQKRKTDAKVESKSKLENSPGFDFDINKADNLSLKYIVGDLGGHRIYVNDIKIYIKTYPEKLTYSYRQPVGNQSEMLDKKYKLNPNCQFKTESPSDNNLFKLQYDRPITISFWADFNSLIKSGITNKSLISYMNSSSTSGWDLSIKSGTYLQLNLKTNGKECFKIPIKFKLNKENMEKENNKTGNFVHYLISTQGYQKITGTRYMCISFMKENDGPQQTIPSSIINNYTPEYVTYDANFDQDPKILENSYIDHVKITNYFFDYTNNKHRMDFLVNMKCFPYIKSKDKIIDYTTDYDKAKPYIDKIQKFGEIGGPLHSSLKNLQDSFHKDFEYDYDIDNDVDKKGFDSKLISAMKSHINLKKTLLEDEIEKGDRQTEIISELENSTNTLNNKIMASINGDLDPYQDKTLKSNSYGSIINYLDNVGQGSYIIRNNDKPGKCLYTSSYKKIADNDTQSCNANDISQKVNVFHVNKDSEYVQHLPKINNTTELHKITNHSEFKYPFKIVKSKNNNQCLHNYDINKYKFSECIPNVAQQYRMWDKESK